MCNNYGRRRGYRDYADQFSHIKIPLVFPDPSKAPNLPPQPDIKPTNQAPIFRRRDEGVEMVFARWWLVPWFYKGPLKEFRPATFNARSEGIATKSSFREAFKRRRCLIPADEWFEYTGPTGNKQRWQIAPRDSDWMCFAGIWDRAETSDAGTVESFAMVMQPAGSPLNTIHDRAPIVLPREHWATWLDLDADVSQLMGPESPDLFNFWKVPSRSAAPAEQGALI